MSRVKNLLNGRMIVYTCPPEVAVLAAYAQERNDFNTWDYERRYSHIRRESERFVYCGDWAASKVEP